LSLWLIDEPFGARHCIFLMHSVMLKMPLYNYACLYAVLFLIMGLQQITLDV
jgi:hypothetical protein